MSATTTYAQGASIKGAQTCSTLQRKSLTRAKTDTLRSEPLRYGAPRRAAMVAHKGKLHLASTPLVLFVPRHVEPRDLAWLSLAYAPALSTTQRVQLAP